MSDIDKSIRLVGRYREGDEQAAEEIFHRYLTRLIGLARSRLSKKLARKVDPDDVVQSAYRSFFRGVKEGRLDVDESGKLWSLLAKITIYKVYRQAQRYGAAGKDVNLEQSVMKSGCVPPENVAREPSPDEANMVSEELQRLLESLSEREREMLELHLQGRDEQEISRQVSRSTRTVRRLLHKVEQRLSGEFDDLRCDPLAE